MQTATPISLGFSLPPYRLPYETMELSAGIGLIGLHWVVQCLYLPAYRAARFSIKQAAEIHPDRLREAIGNGFSPDKLTDDWRSVIDHPEVQVVDCCFGHRRDGLERRLAVVEACAAAGKHLLIQKPVAHNLATAHRMAEMANSGGIHLTVNQNCRFNPATTSIKHLLTPERMGSPAVIEVQQYWGSKARMPAPSRRHASIDHTIHHIDLIRWWVDSPCVSVYAQS